jgi:hypothetical protein
LEVVAAAAAAVAAVAVAAVAVVVAAAGGCLAWERLGAFGGVAALGGRLPAAALALGGGGVPLRPPMALLGMGLAGLAREAAAARGGMLRAFQLEVQNQRDASCWLFGARRSPSF